MEEIGQKLIKFECKRANIYGRLSVYKVSVSGHVDLCENSRFYVDTVHAG